MIGMFLAAHAVSFGGILLASAVALFWAISQAPVLFGMAQSTTSTSPDVFGSAKCELDTTAGAIGITRGTVILNAGAPLAMTLALPTAAVMDGYSLDIISYTAQQHTVTTPANGFNTAYHVFTFGGYIGNKLSLKAYGGGWLVGTTSSATAVGSGTLS